MKKRRRPLPALPDPLKDAVHEQALVASAARRAFAALLRGILMERDPGTRPRP